MTPEAAVVIYDGHCRFCRQQVALLRRMDRGRRLTFTSLHDAHVPTRYPTLTREALLARLHLVEGCGAITTGAAAFRRITRLVPLLWPLAPLLHLPGSLPLWEALYRLVARYRYRFGRVTCDDGSCSLV
jgi:predicted DCC family thiol-disulfide oxidoreductase YuxK